MRAKSFSPEDLAAFRTTKYLYIRSGDHRFLAVWVVVVEGRVIVRSWNDKAKGWYRAFLAEPRGHVKIGDREVPVRGVPLRSQRINDAADEAYAEKYTSKANAKYVKGLTTTKRKATTLELVPA
ncbi:MAG: DUF2255 family protein [Acidobacteriaceae bacterium]